MTKYFAAFMLLFSMLYCNNVVAQLESFVIRDDSASLPMNAIVRYVNDNTAIGYYEDNSYGYFLKLDLTNGTIQTRLNFRLPLFLYGISVCLTIPSMPAVHGMFLQYGKGSS